VRRRRPARAVTVVAGVVALVAVVALAGCGVPVDRSPSALSRKNIPFGLLQPSTGSTTTTSTPPPVETSVAVFLLGSSGHLVAVSRAVPGAEPTLPGVLGALVRGPTNTEAAGGLGTAVPAQTVLLGAVAGAGGVATVNLGGTVGQLVGQAQIQAIAQFVFTATAVPGVTSVAFELSGQAVDVPVASGQEVPVANRAQFAALAPLPVAAG